MGKMTTHDLRKEASVAMDGIFHAAYRILLIEDNPGDADFVFEHFMHETDTVASISHAGTMAEALKLLQEAPPQEGPYDVVILDLDLPDSQGMETVRQVHALAHHTPIVVVSGVVDEQLRTAVLAEGAEEAFSKNEAYGHLFSRSISYVVERDRAQTRHEQLEKVLDATPDGVIVVNHAGVVRYVNQTALRWTSRSYTQFTQDRFFFALPENETVEITIPGPENKSCEMRTVGIKWRDEDALVVSIRDITMLKKSQQEALEKAEQLRQAQKMEAVGRLAGGVAHDFNNLLTAIFSFTGFAMEDLIEEDPAHTNLREVIKAAERGQRLTRQLLAFSRKQIANPRPLNINGFVGDMESMLRRLLGQDILFYTSLADDLWHTKVDPGHLEQVIVNLAVNARDAMPNGGKLIIETRNAVLDEDYVLRHGSTIPKGRYVLLAVSDNGGGIAEEVLPNIFDPFFTTKREGRGTGLGLSTCYGIVRQAGGHIYVYSEPDEGTTFKIYLPHFVGSEFQHEPTPETRFLGGNETILVTEDSDQIRALCERTLSRKGYKVLCAKDGAEALELAEKFPGAIHLLLSDVIMPNMKGRQLSERLRRVRPDLKVLFISGYTEDAVVHHGTLADASTLLPKPFTPDTLVQKVRDVLDAAASLTEKERFRVLCVDDDTNVLHALQRNLKKAYDVTIAASGEAALRLFASRDFDLVLCDIVMPGMTGPELYDLTQKMYPKLAERFVFTTGQVGSHFVESFIQRTRSPFVPKPVNEEQIEACKKTMVMEV